MKQGQPVPFTDVAALKIEWSRVSSMIASLLKSDTIDGGMYKTSVWR